jgi:hypothetical protein
MKKHLQVVVAVGIILEKLVLFETQAATYRKLIISDSYNLSIKTIVYLLVMDLELVTVKMAKK